MALFYWLELELATAGVVARGLPSFGVAPFYSSTQRQTRLRTGKSRINHRLESEAVSLLAQLDQMTLTGMECDLKSLTFK